MLDNDGMLIITRETLEALGSRLADPGQAVQCREEIERMLQIKEALFWRADMGACCAGSGLSARLFAEVRLLETALEALDDSDPKKAASSLREFSLLAESNGTL